MKTNKIDINGGFYLAIALPPYKRKKNREFRVGMADYFQLEYRARTDFYGKTYRTDPGESIFEGYIIKPL